ncbi:MAG: helix-turn-helix domain-containing protein [Spirochaetia bacterium]|nr:helix-turn-helix domain-containing protein [Spirochaetia bacterium]
MVKAKNAYELSSILGLDSNDAAEMEFRADLNSLIIEKYKKSELTHENLAKRAGVSRTRLTALLNNNSFGLSTDFMLRVLTALGYRAKIKVSKIA